MGAIKENLLLLEHKQPENSDSKIEDSVNLILKELRILEKCFNFETLSKIEELDKLDHLEKLSELKSLDKLEKLDNLQNLLQLNRLAKLELIPHLKKNLEEIIQVLPKLNELKAINNLTQLSKLDHLNKLTQLENLDELSSLEQLKSLDNLQNLKSLEKLGNLNMLHNLDKLDSLKELSRLDAFNKTIKEEGHKLDRLQHLDKLDQMSNLEKLTQLSKLDQLPYLDKLSNLTQLDRLDNLAKLNHLDELIQLKELGKLSKLEDLQSLEHLEELENLEKIEELKEALHDPNWKNLDKLEKLNILRQEKKTFMISFAASFLVDVIKVVAVAGLITFFVLTKVNNDQVNKLFGYLSFSEPYGVNMALPLLQKSGDSTEFETVYSNVKLKTQTEIRKYWSFSNDTSFDEKLTMLDYLHKIDYKSNGYDLKADTMNVFQETYKFHETKFDHMTNDLVNYYQADPQTIAFVKQINYMFFNERYEDTYKLAHSGSVNFENKQFLTLAKNLALYHIYKKNDYNYTKTSNIVMN